MHTVHVGDVKSLSHLTKGWSFVFDTIMRQLFSPTEKPRVKHDGTAEKQLHSYLLLHIPH